MSTTSPQKERRCIRCKQELPLSSFIYTECKYFPAHHSLICTSCLETMIDQTNLSDVDALCRHLDIPFDPDKWTALYDVHKDKTLTAYTTQTAGKYESYNWYNESAKWADIRAQEDIDNSVKKFSEQKKKDLIKHWSGDYIFEELIWLEDFYNRILATQNVSTPILEEYAKDLCEIELLIKKGLRAGVDVKKYMDSRDNIIKMARFDATNSKTATAFESIGELMTYVGKKGFHPSYHTEPKDSIDFMMENIQSYNRRIVMNEGNIAELADEKKAAYNLSEQLEENSEDWRKYDNVAEHLEYEGEADLQEELQEDI